MIQKLQCNNFTVLHLVNYLEFCSQLAHEGWLQASPF